MMGTLVGFQPAHRERTAPVVEGNAPGCSSNSKAASSAAMTGPRSLLSELLSAALVAEQRGASSNGMHSSSTHQNNPGCCTVAGDWMDEDDSDAESDADSDEASGAEEEDEAGSYFLIEELHACSRRSNHARLQAALAQAQLAQLLHCQALHQERLAEDLARAAAYQQQMQRQHQAQVEFQSQQKQPFC